MPPDRLWAHSFWVVGVWAGRLGDGADDAERERECRRCGEHYDRASVLQKARNVALPAGAFGEVALAASFAVEDLAVADQGAAGVEVADEAGSAGCGAGVWRG